MLPTETTQEPVRNVLEVRSGFDWCLGTVGFRA